ncbi:phospholipase D-like domain-containing protein [Candidatus Deferrimicrobium sp.]|uniref:phospholipase D-like domain-containing protein n=1 Tax=Candidatus Deferrimicrobium sp. TaxID=3060586 RepID=UPI003C611C25
MAIIMPFLFFFLSISVLFPGSGCATLPKVSDVIDDARTQEPPQILSAKGLLSPEKSKTLMERLKRSVAPTDMLQRYSAVIESVSGSPLTNGNKVTLLIDGPATYAAMFKAMENARDHINLETFIIDDDETGRRFSDLLLKKQAEGVQVNLIYDSRGGFRTPATFFQRLRDAGIQVLAFNPVNPLKARKSWNLAHPDHRKILIVDGKVVFTGGINISSVYSSSPFGKSGLSGGKQGKKAPIPWRDTDIQIEGPVVAEFQKLFLDTWQLQKGPKLSGRNYFPDLKAAGNALVRAVGSSPGESNRLTFVLYVAAITFSENSLHLTNAYFVPDAETVNALRDAAGRGVDVKLVLPGNTDTSLTLSAGRYYYSELLKSGVRLYERRDVLLHAKTAVIDNVWSTVGSTNMDFWSFSSNDEVNAVILNKEFASEMERMFAGDLAASYEIRPEEWEKRPWLNRIKEWFAHQFERWL